MSCIRLVGVMALPLLFVLTVTAQEAQAPPPSPPASNDAQEEAPPPAEEEGPRTLEEIFIPSEEIRADEEVTFPINI